jgi:N-acetyl-gamma-glutamyl-phosphate reductase
MERRGGAHRARIVDLTTDHRPGSGHEDGWVFGLPELNGAAVAGARRVANPGCYPTGVILSLDPLHRAGLLDPGRPVVVNAASGVTGAGRTPRTDLLFAEVFGDYRAYAVGNVHRHLREIRASLVGVGVIFTPHLLPVPRGILETIALPVKEGVGAREVRTAWLEAYSSSLVVRVRGSGEIPCLSGVVGTDRLDLAVVDNEGVPGTLTAMVALDNLGKGAAGQAVQNMNLMLGLPAERGLRC